jgi:hypothetical protein
MFIIGCRSTFPGFRLCKNTDLNAHDQKISRLLSSFNKKEDVPPEGKRHGVIGCSNWGKCRDRYNFF